MADDFIKRKDALKIICGPCGSFTLCELGVEIPCKYFTRMNAIPAADAVEVVRCKNCKHRPVVVDRSHPYGFGLAGPGSDPFSRDETCPYLCDDGYYNRMPDGDGFCNLGEGKDD